MKSLLLLAVTLPLTAQTGIPCKLALGSSATMKGLYGGRTQVIQGRVSCSNTSLNNVTISGVNLDLALPTLDTIPASDASAMLTRTYNNQPGQRVARDLTTGLGVWGVIELSGKIAFSSTVVGAVVSSVVAAIQYIIPTFTNNEPPLNLSNQCDGITGVTLAAGQSLTCTIYINKPPKGSTQIPSAFGFTLGGTPVTPLPPAPPVQLRPQPPGASNICIMEDTPVAGMPPCPRVSTTSELDLSRLEKIMAAHEAGFAAGESCAFESCLVWEERELALR